MHNGNRRAPATRTQSVATSISKVGSFGSPGAAAPLFDDQQVSWWQRPSAGPAAAAASDGSPADGIEVFPWIVW